MFVQRFYSPFNTHPLPSPLFLLFHAPSFLSSFSPPSHPNSPTSSYLPYLSSLLLLPQPSSPFPYTGYIFLSPSSLISFPLLILSLNPHPLSPNTSYHPHLYIPPSLPPSPTFSPTFSSSFSPPSIPFLLPLPISLGTLPLLLPKIKCH